MKIITKAILIFSVFLLGIMSVHANVQDLRPYYTAEQKYVDVGETFDIKNKGMFTVRLDSGMEVQVGIDRPTSDDTDCSEYTQYSGTCGELGASISSPVFDGVASAIFAPGRTSMISTPFFDIVVVAMKNNRKEEDLVYTLKLVDTTPGMIYVSANENFTLLPGQTAKRGIYEIQNIGFGDEGEAYLRFMNNGQEFTPTSKYFRNGAYWMLFGGQFRKDALACLEPNLCVYMSGFNLQDYRTKNDYSTALMGYEVTLAFVETAPSETEVILPAANATSENTSAVNMSEAIFSANDAVGVSEKTEDEDAVLGGSDAEDGEQQAASAQDQQVINSNPVKIAPANGLGEEQKGFFKSIGNFFRSIFGRK